MKENSTSSFRLDEQVYRTLIIVSFLSILILGFRFIGRHPCAPLTLNIQSNTDSFKKDNLISFKAVTQDGNNFTWNYGDGNKDEGTNASVLHRFTKAGVFTVSVTVDDKCSEFQTLVIREDRLLDNNLYGTTFTGPDRAYMGMPVTFTDLSNKSTKWEWHFDDDTKVDATTKSATYIFKTPGTKKVSLMINDRLDLVQTRSIFIIDRNAENDISKASETARAPKHAAPKFILLPTGPTAQPLTNPSLQAKTPENTPKKEEEKSVQKAPELTHVQMESLLMELIGGTKQTEDFSSYLCGNLAIPVVYNSNNLSFSTMCNNLKQLKKKKVKSIKVTLMHNDATNCVQTMVVNVDVKKWPF